MENMDLLKISYLLGSLSFIVGLKMLSSPDSARKGNLYAAVGMLIAILATIFFHEHTNAETGEVERIGNLGYIIGGIAIGTIVGYLAAMKVKMTAMPQMVSLFNGMGGACAALIGIVEMSTHHPEFWGERLIIFLGLMIGSVSFSGSMIAYGKLEGKIRDIGSKVQQVFNNTFVFAILALVIYASIQPDVLSGNAIWVIFGCSLLYGILFVMPIGGADMPVVISLLNSFTGVAAAFGGFLYDNQVMLTGGILVGSAGTILTILMCKAMNRSLWNVIIGAFSASGGPAKSTEGLSIREINVTDSAILCSYAQRVVIVPGYGLAVAQAQHVCHEFEKVLEDKGVEVEFAIHPVAGRMPGHMNVLLAEADVPYPKLKEMDDINPSLPNTDVVIVIGANDVVNPAAETDPSSPIYGMPIIKANTAKNIIVMKRSMAKGYAGIENELFYDDKTRMLFGDAKATLEKLIAEVKSV
ncbi:MAG: NAD(P)(+) transhydrogenase (Re/Si-specific) subunit beta [Chitinophagales bacterium]|nr:NAD(P)(+) transhydrogenase (Re/Si-specific) subunit beta [Chitinophagales bacterium]HAE36156.1 NAD(P) transhydrogenase subunit beta [Bacteroidota bacterium]MCB9019895.1 NAD(P)(+) transhydrogenase (Re/Si-specific) subunit beta [Chitinophagales bacterium]MCB9020655.1 NAD(P)(+) transhydrogenase (Re/Si-specific) subunit beta [Chitinophagales bacterium]MCB9031426.1 NAD(P)(+) transhydrogenase (Re/Si-specific) subunit beta [Chitinophagales bacterium]